MKCVYCKVRKGKRPCPALGGLICSQCCGEHRMVRVSCPADCVYLESNSEYQQKRIGDQFAAHRRDFYKELFEAGGEKAAGLFNLVEVITFTYFQGRHDGQDGEVLAALQALRRTASPLHIPDGPQPVFAEHLKKEYAAFVKQQPEHAPDGHAATDILDRAMKFVEGFSGGGLQSQRFLNGLIGYINTHHPDVATHLTQHADQGGRMVVPGTFPMPSGGVAPPGAHQHGPHCQHHHH